MTADLGALYRACRERITDTVLSADPSEWNLTVPATPEWTIHDVIAHLRGVVGDAIAGNMEGAPGDVWTAAQIARGANDDTQVLLEDWATEAPVFEGVLTASGGEGMVSSAVFDVHTHELDILGALRRPLTVPDAAGSWMTARLATGLVEVAAAAGLPALRVVTREGDDIGAADAVAVLTTTRVDLIRARFGRRSRAQVAALDWGGADPTPYLDIYAIFGPRPDPLVETVL